MKWQVQKDKNGFSFFNVNYNLCGSLSSVLSFVLISYWRLFLIINFFFVDCEFVQNLSLVKTELNYKLFKRWEILLRCEIFVRYCFFLGEPNACLLKNSLSVFFLLLYIYLLTSMHWYLSWSDLYSLLFWVWNFCFHFLLFKHMSQPDLEELRIWSSFFSFTFYIDVCVVHLVLLLMILLFYHV